LDLKKCVRALNEYVTQSGVTLTIEEIENFLHNGAVSSGDDPQHGRPRTLICFSRLRWHGNPRLRHLLGRCADAMDIIVFEEFERSAPRKAALRCEGDAAGVLVVVPVLPAELGGREVEECQRRLLDQLIAERDIVNPILWYDTPMSLAFSDHLKAAAIVYDCADDLPETADVPSTLLVRERQLLSRADLVLTNEDSYETRRRQHGNVHPIAGRADTGQWDNAWLRVKGLIDGAILARTAPSAPPVPSTRSRVRRHGTRRGFDYLIVGAGFAGSVLAERLASQAGKRVLLIDRRSHVGGNAHDCHNDAGILVHPYGPHIFHTNSRPVFDYLSQFTAWRPYEHRVLATVDGKLVPIPINLTTINRLYGLSLTSNEMATFLAERAEKPDEVRTSEDVVIGTVGRELYEKFFRGYTRKQWGIDPSQLDKAVTARIPTRTNSDDRYFGDQFQAMPLLGYSRMFDRMLDHPGIKVLLNADFQEVRDEIVYDDLIYTGPIDEYFDYRFGELPYRSLRFQHVTLNQERFQPCAVVNYPAENVPYTRITEYKHLTGQVHASTSISYEYPCSGGDPYYPVPRPENAALYRKYQALAEEEGNVTFVGRLATYRYYNMDQVVAQALTTFERLVGTKRTRLSAPMAMGVSEEGRARP
jgi:UDP-galactopyranose mutase